MDDFATPGRANFFGLQPSKTNYIKPGKRPLSSMSPTLVFHSHYSSERPDINPNTANNINNDLGKLFMVLGSSGGPKIITSVLQVILNHAILGMSAFSSVVHPRVHDQLLYHGSPVTGYDSCPILSTYDVDDNNGVTEQEVVIETSSRTKEALEKRGHELIPLDYLGTCQVVAVDFETDRLTAVSDVRKGGCSAGY